LTAADRDDSYARLRTEWLRTRAQLIDPDTSLPTLAAVLEDVRRLLAERPLVAVIYAELDSEAEAQNGWQAYDAAVQFFAEALRVLRRDGFLQKEDPIATLGVRSEAFAVFTAGRGEPLDRDGVAKLTGTLVTQLGKLLEQGGEQRLGFHHGFALLRRDPMLRHERSILRAVDEAVQMALVHRALEENELTVQLGQIIAEGRIQTLSQPVVRLSDRGRVGVEVFSRGPTGSPFESPLRLLALAERCGRLVELEQLFLRRALELVGRRLERGQKLFLNTTAVTLREHLPHAAFAAQVDQARLSRGDVVIDVSERLTQIPGGGAREAVARLKGAGFLVALDDMGGGRTSLQPLAELAPDFLKFDIALVRDIHRSRIKRGLLETLLEFSGKIGSRVVAEGIETSAELETVQEMGVELGQGHHLGRPTPVAETGGVL
jgi:EAL domain-containing protein (putative c-di-GMP-specific phosphodiesterase class I)